jgi:N-acetylmuramoyl-L-alanine amidase CwlA
MSWLRPIVRINLSSEEKMNIKINYLSLGKKARTGRKFKQPPSHIIIHWIGPYFTNPRSRVDSTRNWWENGADGTGVAASAHFVIFEDYILQCLPLDEIGWHSGDSRNFNSIGIEVVPITAAGEFNQKTIDSLKLLCDYVKKEIGGDLTIERHYDGTQKKDCPRYYTPVVPDGQKRWEELLRAVS